MVYESDFYTTRRPYRSTPAFSTYTVSSTPSKQVRILPGLGKVHIVHTYDRIVPYIGHKRLTVVTLPPKIYSTRSSVLKREYDWIEKKVRPWVAYSPTNRYLNSDSSVRFVYVRNPISGLTYHSEYIPSRYYNFYRIIRPLTSYDDYWFYYRPLSLYSSYWPLYRTLSYLDDIPIYRSLRLQRKFDSLFDGLDYPNYYRNYNYYNYYRRYRPLSLYYDYYWPVYTYYNNYYYTRYYRSLLDYNLYYWPVWKYYQCLNYWSPKRSYYWLKYVPMSYYLNNLSSRYTKYLKNIFDDETRLIRAQTASLLKQIYAPVPRIRSWPISPLNRSGDVSSLPVKYSNDTYIHRLLTVSPSSKIEYATYYTEPAKKYIGQGRLSCVSYAGDRGYSRRRPLAIYEDAVKNDIQLLSYYINKFRQEKSQPKEIKVPLSASRPSRIFSVHKPIEDPMVQEIKDLREARAIRLSKIYETDLSAIELEDKLKSKKEKEETRLAQEKERSLAEEKARKEAQAKKEEAARKAEVARQEKLAAQAAAERAAELERQAEHARQEELAKQAEIEKARQLEEERARLEEQRLLEEQIKAEEERQQLLRLEEIARQAEEAKEAELARQAEELAELARQEAERIEQEREEREAKEKAQKEAELAELSRQEAELAELERQEKELAELAKQEAELAEKAEKDAEIASKEAELATQEAKVSDYGELLTEVNETENKNEEEYKTEDVSEVKFAENDQEVTTGGKPAFEIEAEVAPEPEMTGEIISEETTEAPVEPTIEAIADAEHAVVNVAISEINIETSDDQPIETLSRDEIEEEE